MNYFDSEVIAYLNQFARRSWAFDQVTAFLSVNHLMKGGVLMVLVWWAWFRNRNPTDREHLLATLFSCVIALGIGRAMVLGLPFRQRPLAEERLEFVLPYGLSGRIFEGLSSFPSDHAVLFFGLATGLFFISKRVGLLAFVYVAMCISLPRIYLGLHYPTDILAGAVVGVAICLVANRYLPQRKSVQWVKALSQSSPQIFYPMMFLVTYQIADLFDNSRLMVSGIFALLRRLVQ